MGIFIRNVLIDNGVAVLIDFDSSGFASAAMDPVTALLSTLVHRTPNCAATPGRTWGRLRVPWVRRSLVRATPTRPGSVLSLLGQANEARAARILVAGARVRGEATPI